MTRARSVINGFQRECRAFWAEAHQVKSFSEFLTLLSETAIKHEEKVYVAKFLALGILLSYTGVRIPKGFQTFLVLAIVGLSFLSGGIVIAHSMWTSDSMLQSLRKCFTLNPLMRTSDEDKAFTPWITFGLIVVNTSLLLVWTFYPREQQIFRALYLGFPAQEPYQWLSLLSYITSIFTHSDGSHLLWNMLFLGAFGVELERVLGRKLFFALYIGLGLIAGIPGFLAQLGNDRILPSVGASGAICGLMGLYVVRCYFRKITWPLLLFPLPIFLRIKVNAIALTAMYLVWNMSGLVSGKTGVSYAAHLGGMFAGIYLAYRLGLHHKAREDRHRELALEGLNNVSGWGGNEKEMRKVLELNPENTEVLLALARFKTKIIGVNYERSEEGAQLYEKLISILLKSKPQQAADVFVEYHKKFQRGIEPTLTYRLASILYRRKQLFSAASALELVLESESLDDKLGEKALYQVANIMKELKFEEAAEMYYERFLECFPASVFAPAVKAKLGFASYG